MSPKSLNGLRGNVHTIFARAIERGLWQGQNPAKAVKRRKVPRKVFDTLKADEVPELLAALTPQWRPLFACAVYTGLRKGELLGLRKSDVDLEEATNHRAPLLRPRHHQGRARGRAARRAAAATFP